MTAAPPVIQRWLEFVDSGLAAEPGGRPAPGPEDMLAEDAVFHSPAVFAPQRGRALAAAYLRAAEQMFSGAGFHYVDMWFGERSAVLEFAAEVDGLSVEGVDMIRWGDDDKITSVKVMIRPFTALQLVIGKMAELLAGG